MSFKSLICFALYCVFVMGMISAKFSHATWQALKDSRFCMGPDYARAISGHFLWCKFGDLSLKYISLQNRYIPLTKAEQEPNRRHEL